MKRIYTVYWICQDDMDYKRVSSVSFMTRAEAVDWAMRKCGPYRGFEIEETDYDDEDWGD